MQASPLPGQSLRGCWGEGRPQSRRLWDRSISQRDQRSDHDRPRHPQKQQKSRFSASTEHRPSCDDAAVALLPTPREELERPATLHAYFILASGRRSHERAKLGATYRGAVT